jgi:hypothetical protein
MNRSRKKENLLTLSPFPAFFYFITLAKTNRKAVAKESGTWNLQSPRPSLADHIKNVSLLLKDNRFLNANT